LPVDKKKGRDTPKDAPLYSLQSILKKPDPVLCSLRCALQVLSCPLAMFLGALAVFSDALVDLLDTLKLAHHLAPLGNRQPYLLKPWPHPRVRLRGEAGHQPRQLLLDIPVHVEILIHLGILSK